MHRTRAHGIPMEALIEKCFSVLIWNHTVLGNLLLFCSVHNKRDRNKIPIRVERKCSSMGGGEWIGVLVAINAVQHGGGRRHLSCGSDGGCLPTVFWRWLGWDGCEEEGGRGRVKSQSGFGRVVSLLWSIHNLDSWMDKWWKDGPQCESCTLDLKL